MVQAGCSEEVIFEHGAGIKCAVQASRGRACQAQGGMPEEGRHLVFWKSSRKASVTGAE